MSWTWRGRYPTTLILRMYCHLAVFAISLPHLKLRELLKFLVAKSSYKNTSHRITASQSYLPTTTCSQYCLITLVPSNLVPMIKCFHYVCKRRNLITLHPAHLPLRSHRCSLRYELLHSCKVTNAVLMPHLFPADSSTITSSIATLQMVYPGLD